MLVGLTGKKRSGKDSFAGVLVARFGFARVAFADPLKEAALVLNPIVGTNPFTGDPIRLDKVVERYGWEDAKDDFSEVRLTALQNLGMAVRTLDEGFWTRVARQRIDALLAQGRSVVVTDVRFPNERDLIHDLGGVHVHVDRPGLVSTDPHPSETAMEPYYSRADLTVTNDGTLDDLATTATEALPIIRALTGDS